MQTAALIGSRIPGKPPKFEAHALTFADEGGVPALALRCWLKNPIENEAKAVMALSLIHI